MIDVLTLTLTKGCGIFIYALHSCELAVVISHCCDVRTNSIKCRCETCCSELGAFRVTHELHVPFYSSLLFDDEQQECIMHFMRNSELKFFANENVKAEILCKLYAQFKEKTFIEDTSTQRHLSLFIRTLQRQRTECHKITII